MYNNLLKEFELKFGRELKFVPHNEDDVFLLVSKKNGKGMEELSLNDKKLVICLFDFVKNLDSVKVFKI